MLVADTTRQLEDERRCGPKPGPPGADRRAARRATLGLLSGPTYAPHTNYEKDKEFDYAPNGIRGLETALAVVAGRARGPQKIQLAQVVVDLDDPASRAQSSVCQAGVPRRRRSAADVCLFDPTETWRLRRLGRLEQVQQFPPWEGKKLTGRVKTNDRGRPRGLRRRQNHGLMWMM